MLASARRCVEKSTHRVHLLLEALEDRLLLAGQPLVEPPVIRSENGVLRTTLTLAQGPATIGDTAVVNAWTYNRSYVGPTLQVQPGDLLDIVLDNQIPQETNLHVHGLHVSPLGNSDNVLLQILPGTTNHYQIQIPANHPEGLYWYHPHRHGVVNPQIAMGLSGLLVIGRADGGAPQLNGMKQNLLALQNALLAGNQITVPVSGSNVSAQTFTVNGQLNPALTMRPNEIQVFNVANIGNNAFYSLNVFDANNNPVGVRAVAIDGNPFTEVLPQPGGVGLPPGRRWSFLVRAPATATTWTLQTGGFSDGTNTWPSQTLATIQIAGDPVPVQPPPTTLSPPNNYYHDLRDLPVAQRRTAIFEQDPNNPQATVFKINGAEFPNNPVFQPRLNTVEEWTLINRTPDDHPFHLHTNPHQITKVINANGPGQPNGFPRFQDVTNVPAMVGDTPGQVVIRVQYRDFLGTLVYHCHRVDHEDDGMMALVDIIPERPVYATGAGQGGGPQVNVYDAATNALVTAFDAFDPVFRGGVQVAVGDLNRDAIPDYVVGAGPGGGPHVKAISGRDGRLLQSFMAYDPSFTGGVFVGTGDVNNDGFDDIITGAGPGGGPHVRAFDGRTGTPLQSFMAYDVAFRGGVAVASGDVTLDGRDKFITGAGPGGGPHVVVFSQAAQPIASFFAYDPSFTGGVWVGSGRVRGLGTVQIITGPGPGGGPQVLAFDLPTAHRASGSPSGHGAASSMAMEALSGAALSPMAVASFFAYDPLFRGGVRVGIVATPVGDNYLTGAGPGGGPEVRRFSGLEPRPVASFFPFDPTFAGGVFVGGG